jgi:ATP synthase subunit 6
MLFSALEQFQIFPLVYGVHYYLSITNQTITLCIVFIFFFLGSFLTINTHYGFVIPGRFQIIIETLYTIPVGILYENTGKTGIRFFPFIFTVCLFILLSNMVGLIPYSLTVTSHLVITLALSLSLFIGIVSVIVKIHGLKSLQLFLPKGTSLALAFLLVPIEVVSFIFKPLSLGVRLFANIIAGHTLLKVIGGFSWVMILKGGILFSLHFLPLIILVLLIGLELGVGLIQTYVFLILVCIYFREAMNLH